MKLAVDPYMLRMDIVNPPGSTARIHQHLDIGQGEVDWDLFFATLAEVGSPGATPSHDRRTRDIRDNRDRNVPHSAITTAPRPLSPGAAGPCCRGRPGADAAVAAGLSGVDWFRSDVPRRRMKELMQLSDSPAIRDTALWLGGMVGEAATEVVRRRADGWRCGSASPPTGGSCPPQPSGPATRSRRTSSSPR